MSRPHIIAIFVIIPLLPSITSDCCRLDDYVSLHYLLKHMAHLVQAAVWTAGLDDRLTDSGLISFQLCKAYAPPVGVKGQISTVCLYTAGGNLASKDNFILFYLDRFDGGTVFRCIMISPGRYSPQRPGQDHEGRRRRGRAEVPQRIHDPHFRPRRQHGAHRG